MSDDGFAPLTDEEFALLAALDEINRARAEQHETDADCSEWAV